MDSGTEAGGRAPLQRARDRAAEALSQAFASDDLTLAEFEDRVDRCYQVATVRELEELFEDLPVAPRLPGPEEGAAAEAASDVAVPPPSAPASRRGFDVLVGFWSGVGRKGSWTPARRTLAVGFMGGVELDFRQARFPPGETVVDVAAVMGGVEITVPPGLRVESFGLPLMGGFDRLDQDGDGSRAPGAVLRIRGLALMGGVEIRVARTGEEESGRQR